MLNLPRKLAALFDPVQIFAFSPFRLRIAACCLEDSIGFGFVYYIGARSASRFRIAARLLHTLTLKPCLTASAPEVCTGRWLDFAGFGVSPNYIFSTVLAHPPENIKYTRSTPKIKSAQKIKITNCFTLEQRRRQI